MPGDRHKTKLKKIVSNLSSASLISFRIPPCLQQLQIFSIHAFQFHILFIGLIVSIFIDAKCFFFHTLSLFRSSLTNSFGFCHIYDNICLNKSNFTSFTRIKKIKMNFCLWMLDAHIEWENTAHCYSVWIIFRFWSKFPFSFPIKNYMNLRRGITWKKPTVLCFSPWCLSKDTHT